MDEVEQAVAGAFVWFSEDDEPGAGDFADHLRRAGKGVALHDFRDTLGATGCRTHDSAGEEGVVDDDGGDVETRIGDGLHDGGFEGGIGPLPLGAGRRDVVHEFVKELWNPMVADLLKGIPQIAWGDNTQPSRKPLWRSALGQTAIAGSEAIDNRSTLLDPADSQRASGGT